MLLLKDSIFNINQVGFEWIAETRRKLELVHILRGKHRSWDGSQLKSKKFGSSLITNYDSTITSVPPIITYTRYITSFLHRPFKNITLLRKYHVSQQLIIRCVALKCVSQSWQCNFAILQEVMFSENTVRHDIFV